MKKSLERVKITREIELSKNIKSLIDFDARHEMFSRAVRFVDYELVEGDILEFGVYTGRSLALFSYYHEAFKETRECRVLGYFLRARDLRS